jgi:hypothetical protein
MSEIILEDPTELCEQALRKHIQRNTELNIWPSQIAVAERLIERRTEMADVYVELVQSFGNDHTSLYKFFDIILGTTVVWNPNFISINRVSRNRLVEINEEIGRHALHLSELLDERDKIHNSSAFRDNTFCSICDVIEAASENNNRFKSSLKQPLQELQHRFDGKYWPCLGDVLRAISVDADYAEIEPSNPITAKATSSKRPSKSDFARGLLAAITQITDENDGRTPHNLKFFDNALSSLVNCTFNLGGNELTDAVYIKNLRQRDRK